MTYFLTRDVQYHRRGFVSRSCSGKGKGGSETLWSPSVTCAFVAVEPSNVKR